MLNQIFKQMVFCLGALLILGVVTSPVDAEQPNIVFILADDLGYGDLGCYGQEVIKTPTLDALAANGMKFTQHYAGCTVCAPSRSCLMTGQHTGHTTMRGNGKNVWLVAQPEAERDITVASLLNEAGYQTAMIGKSSTSGGVPDDFSHPNQLGFDHFFGVLGHAQAHHYFPPVVYRNGEKIELAGNQQHEGEHYAHDLYLDEALSWLGETDRDKPFFLHYSAHIPHASISVNEEWIKPYREIIKEDRSVERQHYDGSDAVKAEFAGMVSRLDWEVGQLMKKLEELGVDENTVVFFASDNGAHSAGGHRESDFNSSGDLRGEKRDLYEGGIRTPLIVHWPDKIKPGSVSDHASAFWDFLPTCCELAGIKTPAGRDGISYLPTLVGDPGNQKAHEYLYWEFHEQGGKRAVRIGDLKAVQLRVNRNADGPLEVYNLATDPSEENNIAESHSEFVKQAREIFVTARTTSRYPKFEFKEQ